MSMNNTKVRRSANPPAMMPPTGGGGGVAAPARADADASVPIKAARQSPPAQQPAPKPRQQQQQPPHPSPKRRRVDDGLHRQLVFAPLAWLKLRVLLHGGDTEVGGFGIAAEDDLLYIDDLAVPVQRTTAVTVEFDDGAVADHFDDCLDRGIGPARCGRLWIHTHPGSSPAPSSTDEQTFARAFGDCDWAVMAIIARDGSTYARLRFGAGPGGSMIMPITVDWERFPQDLLDHEGQLEELIGGWLDEYGSKVHPVSFFDPPQQTRQEAKHGGELPPRLRFGEAYDPFDAAMDELYERMMLDQQFDEEFERREREVWP
jgi:hypothetical protein